MRPLMLSLLLLAGCDYGFEKQSHVGKLRVLAVRAEPPEIIAGDGPADVTLTALAVDPSGAPVEVRYALCSFAGLPAADLDCPGADGTPLEPSDAVSARLRGSVELPAGAPAVIQLAIGFHATAGAESLHGFAALNVRTSAGGPANRNPSLETVILPDTVKAGEKISLRPVPAADAVEAGDKLTYSFFATAGDLDALRSTDLDPAVDWTAPAEAGLVRFWIVVRDGRGGTGWLARSLQVLP